MKKLYLIVFLMFAMLASYSQQAPVVSFDCHDENNNPQRLDSVRIENWTRSWAVTIYYPNLTISLGDVTNGITELEFDEEGLARNIPNPFNGRTHAQLTLSNNEHIIMRAFDITGKAVAYYEGQLEAGKHDFEIVLSTPQTYILQVATSRKTYAIKMVNTGNGGENKINLQTSNNEVVLKSAKQIMDYDFEVGDCMHYQGFVTVGNEVVRTEPITQNQYESELITFVLHTQQTTTAPVGIYAGVVGFNNQLYVKPIDVLNNSTQYSFRNFINNLPMGNGTILYHADYTALNNIASTIIPDELINVTLVTFTDGLDLGSWRMNPVFTSETAYLNAVHSRILNDQLGGVNITAYAIGVKGSDVTDTAQFRHDLRMLSSDPEHNVYEVADISEVNAQFREVAAQLNQTSIVTTDISLLLPAPDPGTRVRFTFDDVTSATSSYYYIEGTYNYSNGVGTLSNIVYEGLTSTSGNMVTGTAQGIFDRFVFTDVKDLLQQQLNINNIKQWYFIPSTQQWQHNSEFTTSNSTSSQQVHNSAIAMLVLDCSSSLGSSGFNTMKSSANNFLDILRNSNTLSAPTVQTQTATTVSDISATLNGSVTNSGNLIIHECGFVLSLSPNMSNATFYNANSSNSFNYTVTGLTPNTTYYYKAFARNNRGTGYGTTQSFTTPTLPAVTTYSVSNVTGYSALSGGTVTSTGNATVTARGVCYGTSHNPTIDGLHTSNGTGGGFFSSSIAGLNPGTTYYVRAYATNIVGTVYGEELCFTTSVVLPEVTTTEIANNLGATATSGGDVTNAGGGTITARGICWSTSQNPTISNSHTTNGSGMGSFTSNMTGLSLNTTYYVRAYATNSAGTAYGNQLSFTTPNIPTVTTNTVSSITTTTASCGGNVTATGGVSVTARGVCWSTSQNPTVSSSHTTDGNGTGSFTSSITGLNPGTTYYVRAYATNSAGTAYGTQRTFTTSITTPTVTTNTVSNITSSTATCGGNVTATGGASVTARGICWCTSQNPTVSNDHTTNGTGSGSYTSSMTGLTPGTTYYVRAYATNSQGTTYGIQRSFTTQTTVPTVTTNTVSNITATTATCGGNVTATGGATVTARGVCWSTSQNPTVNDSHSSNGTGSGSFTSSITGLNPGTTYYVRAYATNNVGTSYGSQRTLTTRPTDSAPCGICTDYDDNTYNTVQIGNQCWMKENLRTTHYANGTSIALGSSTSTTTAYRYYPNNSSSNVSTYGYLYNWKAVMNTSSSSSSNPSGVQGICPNGWHVPSDAEWTQLTDYVGSQPQYQCNNSSANIAKAFAATTGWNISTETCAVGNNLSANNVIGFSAVPAGNYSNIYNYYGYNSHFWSTTQGNSSVWGRGLHNDLSNVVRGSNNNYCGFSVRCLRNEGISIPIVTTAEVSQVSGNTAVSGGNISFDGGASVTARGICWGTTPNPTVSNSHTTEGSGTGSFTSNITGLVYNTVYYVRAYATNSQGTSYGEQRVFTTHPACSGNPTITDYDGNVYQTVQIGNQCWMKENLRTTHYANGTNIALGSSTSTTTAYRYYPGNNSTNVTTYGYLYNWAAVMNDAGSSAFNPSGVQGICPNGWHVPSDAEWTQLTDYVGSQSAYLCGNDSSYITKALVATIGWNISMVTCAAGNNLNVNNVTGFSALPAGYYHYNGNYSSFSNIADFWSSTENVEDKSFYINFHYNFAYINRDNFSKSGGFSVRCLRNDGISVPAVSSAMVSSITGNTATCGGNVISDGGDSVTVRGICWSTSQNPTVNDNHTTDGSGIGNFTSNMTELSPNTTYYVRAYATNSVGTNYGVQRTFTTLVIVPTVTTNTVSDITAATATCGGTVTATGGASVTARGICWSTSQNPTISNLHTSDGTGVGGFTSSITGLLPNTTYYVRAYATNSAGTAYGTQQSFTTQTTVPTVTTNTVSSITSSTATCGGGVTSTGGVSVTARGVCWGTSQNPTVSDTHTTNGTGSGSFTSSITGLAPGTTYYVRAYATNSVGTSYGEQRSFTTLAVTPTVTTNTVSSITATTATCGGNVTNTGGATVTARGVCWSTSQNPTVSGSHTTNGTGSGSFTSNITGLSPVTTYYVRAYATNSAGTAYGAQQSFTTPLTVPTVTTNTVSNITDATATCGGNVTATGGAAVTARGVCWSTSPNPTVSDSHTTNDNGIGSFTSNMTGLNHSTTYYVRAYATNSAGTGYGAQRSFTTRAADGQPCLGTPTVSDYDNNTYNTVQIGNQCWTKENLRSTCYANGDCIELGSSTSTTTAYRYYPNNNSSNVSTYGYLYNWAAVMHGASSSSANPSGRQGVCPNGWHVPSEAEWTQLENYVKSQSAYRCNSTSTNIAKALSSTTGWSSNTEVCAPGNTPANNNATGFGAQPEGRYTGSYSSFGHCSNFWSCTVSNSKARAPLIYYDRAEIENYSYDKHYGFSVRCVKN